MEWVLLAAVVLGIYELRNRWPVKGLKYIDSSSLDKMKVDQFKWIDVRDFPDYQKGHPENAIHIFVGRLPFVWSSYLQPDDQVVLIGRNRRMIRKAARILKKKGIQPPMFACVCQSKTELSSGSYRSCCQTN